MDPKQRCPWRTLTPLYMQAPSLHMWSPHLVLIYSLPCIISLPPPLYSHATILTFLKIGIWSKQTREVSFHADSISIWCRHFPPFHFKYSCAPAPHALLRTIGAKLLDCGIQLIDVSIFACKNVSTCKMTQVLQQISKQYVVSTSVLLMLPWSRH